MNLILGAIEKVAVQDADGTLHIPPGAARRPVCHKDYQGLTGNLTCTPPVTALIRRLQSTLIAPDSTHQRRFGRKQNGISF